MLFYLDNFLSADPNAAQRQAAERAMRQQMRRRPYGYPPRSQPQQAQNKKQQRGLNENYGREMMELHTPGVDGGYTQKEVTEVARAFTGLANEKPRRNSQFQIEQRLDDPGPKTVLRRKNSSGGIKDSR